MRQEVLKLEQRREELSGSLMTTLRSVRELDGLVRRFEQLAGRVRQDDDEIARTQRQIATLEDKLADARRNGPQPDRVQTGPPRVVSVQQGRVPKALLAGVVAAFAAWLISFGTIARNPLQRDTRRRLAALMRSRATR